jgi:F-type H+-transporting ATPase subunit b
MADLVFLAHAAAEQGGEHAEASALYMGPGGWVGLSMIALIGIMLYLRVPALVAGALDKKIEGIKTMLDEAAELRKQAEALKAEYEKKIRRADEHAAELTAAAEEEAKAIVKKAKADATALIARRERMAEDKIGAAERAAIGELRARAANSAAAAARGLIAKKHDAAADKELVDKAISGI